MSGPTPGEAYGAHNGSDKCGCHGSGQTKVQVKTKRKYVKFNINYLGAAPKPTTTVPLNALGTDRPGYKMLEAVVDSGAAKSTCGKHVFPGKIRPSEMSRLGLSFSGPDGSEIPNFGELDAFWESEEGFKCRMVMQISDVDRILLACTELADNGFDTTFRKNDGLITNLRNQKSMKLIRKNGVYILRMWIKVDGTAPFQGQGM